MEVSDKSPEAISSKDHAGEDRTTDDSVIDSLYQLTSQQTQQVSADDALEIILARRKAKKAHFRGNLLAPPGLEVARGSAVAPKRTTVASPINPTSPSGGPTSSPAHAAPEPRPFTDAALSKRHVRTPTRERLQRSLSQSLKGRLVAAEPVPVQPVASNLQHAHKHHAHRIGPDIPAKASPSGHLSKDVGRTGSIDGARIETLPTSGKDPKKIGVDVPLMHPAHALAKEDNSHKALHPTEDIGAPQSTARYTQGHPPAVTLAEKLGERMGYSRNKLPKRFLSPEAQQVREQQERLAAEKLAQQMVESVSTMVHPNPVSPKNGASFHTASVGPSIIPNNASARNTTSSSDSVLSSDDFKRDSVAAVAPGAEVVLAVGDTAFLSGPKRLLTGDIDRRAFEPRTMARTAKAAGVTADAFAFDDLSDLEDDWEGLQTDM